MPSHLTRLVFRQLLANEPIASSQCLRRSIRPQYALLRPRLHHRAQRRHFFNLFQGPKPREAILPDLAPGLETLVHYAKMKRLKARLPAPEAVADAMTKFMKHKTETGRAINDTEAQYLLHALEHVQSHAADHFPTTTLRSFMRALASPKIKSSPMHRDLAVALYDAYRHHPSWAGAVVSFTGLQALVEALSMLGYPAQARDFVTENAVEAAAADSSANKPETVVTENTVEVATPDPSAKNIHPALRSALWYPILQAFAKEGNGVELQKSLEQMESFGIQSHSMSTVSVMVEHSAAENNLEAVEKWYGLFKTGRDKTTKDPYRVARVQQALLRMSVRQRDFEYGQSIIIKDIMTNKPTKLQWDLIFEFAAGTGKGVDELDRMMGVMEKANRDTVKGDEPCLPDVDTINRLVEFAISKKDPYMAERFIVLGKKRGIEPNAHTLVLQIDYRLSVNDMDGALTAYKQLQEQDTTDDNDIPAVNRLIVALCTSGRQDFDTIMNVAADLSERRARFEPATVCALSVLHLSRFELDDVEDLLNTHCFSFSQAERETVISTLLSFCTNPNTPTAASWETYNLLKKTFDEMTRDPRETLMLDFFRRERPDMAVHVFTHMRLHTRADTTPTSKTYISALRGIAKLGDIESLDAVHNHLKLDYTIEPDTRLLNALILAFTACEQPRRALTFWNEIVASREGPTVSSIHLALRACELSPWGDEKAREIWTRLRRTGLELDEGLWASYLAALVGNGDLEGMVEEFEGALKGEGVVASGFIIASIHNACPGSAKKADFDAWATARHPRLWAQLQQTHPLKKSEVNGQMYFPVDRSVEP